MRKYIYCHETKSQQYDDIAIVVAKSKTDAINKLLQYYSDVTMDSIHAIKSTKAIVKQDNIQIISDY